MALVPCVPTSANQNVTQIHVLLITNIGAKGKLFPLFLGGSLNIQWQKANKREGIRMHQCACGEITEGSPQPPLGLRCSSAICHGIGRWGMDSILLRSKKWLVGRMNGPGRKKLTCKLFLLASEWSREAGVTLRKTPFRSGGVIWDTKIFHGRIPWNYCLFSSHVKCSEIENKYFKNNHPLLCKEMTQKLKYSIVWIGQ